MPGSSGRNRAVTGVPGILKSNTVVRSTVVRMGEGRGELTYHALYQWHQGDTCEEDSLCLCLSVSKESSHCGSKVGDWGTDWERLVTLWDPPHFCFLRV